jgi:hypothetical protein
MQQMVLYCKTYCSLNMFRAPYVHHQELKSIIQLVAACGTWCFGLHVVGLAWSCRLCVRFSGYCSRAASRKLAPRTTGSNHLYNTLELLVMGIWCPKHVERTISFAIKNHLLHLVSLFISTN